MEDREVTRLLTVALPPDEPPMITAAELFDAVHRRRRRRLTEAAAIGGAIVLVGGIATGTVLVRGDHGRWAAAPPGASSTSPASSSRATGAGEVQRLDRAVQQAIRAGTPPPLRDRQDPYKRIELRRDAAGTWHALFRGAEPSDPNSNVLASEFRFTIVPQSPSGAPCQGCETTTRPDGSTIWHWETSTPKGAGCTYAWWAVHQRRDGSRVTVELSSDVSQGCATIDWIYDLATIATYPQLHA